MTDDRALAEIIAGIEGYDSFTLFSHVSPDGDTLGSAAAMCILLEGMGKTVEIVCEDRVPHIYQFLPGVDRVKLPQDAVGYECAVAMDCADVQRFKKGEYLFKNARYSMSIDHHFTNKGYADANLIRDTASATAEIVYDIYHELDKPITPEAAVCIYTGIVTDTGNLTYSITTPKSIRIVAELLENGLNITEVNRRIYRTVPFRKTRVQGFAMSNMQLEYNGTIGIATLTVPQMERFGATSEDCEGIVDMVRDVESVRVAIFIREGRDGTYKVSMRSKECADVGKIAKRFGGGGHAGAAGYTSDRPLSTTIAEILSAVEAEMVL